MSELNLIAWSSLHIQLIKRNKVSGGHDRRSQGGGATVGVRPGGSINKKILWVAFFYMASLFSPRGGHFFPCGGSLYNCYILL